MKKLIAFAVILTILVTFFAGCGINIGGKNITGVDAAKLLLANMRLDAEKLGKRDIFSDGVEVMNNLAVAAKENYIGDPSLMFLSNTKADSGYIWKGFKKETNSLGYFNNITESIVFCAENGAELIDYAKKNIKIIEKWVREGNDQQYTDYFLIVEENSEAIIQRTEDSVKICYRYKNNVGLDVYELYEKYWGELDSVMRMTYIPQRRFEWSSIIDDGDNHMRDYFVADNSKGYWETYIVGDMPEHYNISYFIMKDDICYDAFYDPKTKEIPLIKIMSDNKEADIMNFYDSDEMSSIDIKIGAFDGIDCISVEKGMERELYYVDGHAVLPDPSLGRLHLDNGKVLRSGDTFMDEKVQISSILASYDYVGTAGITGEFGVRVTGETKTERIATLKNFLTQNGISCKYNLDRVFKGIDRAYDELEGLTRYYTWNGCNVSDEAGIARAIEIEHARFDEMYQMYIDHKDKEIINRKDAEAMKLNMSFSPVSVTEISELFLSDMSVTAKNVTLNVESTLLFVENQEYTVGFSLISADGGNSGLVHLDVKSSVTSLYAGEKSFTVSASDISFELPMLDVGKYTLVGYIITTDGIRSSDYVPLAFNGVQESKKTVGNISVSTQQNADGTVLVAFAENIDVYETLTVDTQQDYSSFYVDCMTAVNKYGVATSDIEKYDEAANEYTALVQDGGLITDGNYRVAYNIVNGDYSVAGYIYISYSCEQPAEEVISEGEATTEGEAQ